MWLYKRHKVSRWCRKPVKTIREVLVPWLSSTISGFSRRHSPKRYLITRDSGKPKSRERKWRSKWSVRRMSMSSQPFQSRLAMIHRLVWRVPHVNRKNVQRSTKTDWIRCWPQRAHLNDSIRPRINKIPGINKKLSARPGNMIRYGKNNISARENCVIDAKPLCRAYTHSHTQRDMPR